MQSGLPFRVRDYQKGAVDAFYAGGDVRGGSGVIVLPCGAGKTIVGLAAMAALKSETLILTTSTTAVEQWKREIIDKTDIDPALVGTYTGDSEDDGAGDAGDLPDRHLSSQERRRFPPFPPVRRARLGPDHLRRSASAAGAGLSRHGRYPGPPPAGTDRNPGPRRSPRGRRLQPDRAQEVRRSLASSRVQGLDRRSPVPRGATRASRRRCAWNTPLAEWREKFRVASENPLKDEIVAVLLDRFDGPDDRVIVIGQYLKQLRRIAERFDLPLITGATSNAEREDLYGRFRTGALRRLVLSKVGNFAIDLPDANVMIQISGTFGSRQEEAQRLGRILRPKEGEQPARFYTLVSRDTREMDFAHHRQLFLTEQGYSYEIVDETDLAPGPARDEPSLRPASRRQTDDRRCAGPPTCTR